MRLFLLPVALFLFSANTRSQDLPQLAPAQKTESLPIRNPKTNCAPVRFSGEVERDKRYVHVLPGNLEFRLLPSREGWSIDIGRPGDKAEDYAGIATPPYHGVNALIIEAWHFRNADNTGPNEGQVNAPTNVLDFSFVLTHAAYLRFLHALNVWSGSDAATEQQRQAATNFLLNGPRQAGTLRITDMELGGLEKGTRPWFEWMKFKVDLCFPPPAAPSPAKESAGQAPSPKKTP